LTVDDGRRSERRVQEENDENRFRRRTSTEQSVLESDVAGDFPIPNSSDRKSEGKMGPTERVGIHMSSEVDERRRISPVRGSLGNT